MFRFVVVSIALSAPWVSRHDGYYGARVIWVYHHLPHRSPSPLPHTQIAISSELSTLRAYYGPSILLWLNLAYFAPSIPLLIISTLFDTRLERAFGFGNVLFVRLCTGLFGCAIISLLFPFLPNHNPYSLLAAVAVLGVFVSLSFAASYQLVSRAARKNVVALGMGCSASGPVVLLLELLTAPNRHSPHPTPQSQIKLFFSLSILVCAGLWATVSLLLRHWPAINADTDGEGGERGRRERARGDMVLRSPILSSSHIYSHCDIEEEEADNTMVLPLLSRQDSRGAATTPTSTLRLPLERKISPMLFWTASEAHETYVPPIGAGASEWYVLDGEDAMMVNNSRSHSHSTALGLCLMSEEVEYGTNGTTLEGISNVLLSRENNNNRSIIEDDKIATVADDDQYEEEEGQRDHQLRDTMKCLAPALFAIAAQSYISLLLFPFFTYIPSAQPGGLIHLGDMLPRVLFWVRILADLGGRALPRLQWLAPSKKSVVSLAVIKIALVPPFFVYLKLGERWHSDVVAVGYIFVMWLLSGLLNTGSNVLAPSLVVSGRQKSSAASLVAVTYQFGHLLGLLSATGLAAALYGGKIGPGG